MLLKLRERRGKRTARQCLLTVSDRVNSLQLAYTRNDKVIFYVYQSVDERVQLHMLFCGTCTNVDPYVLRFRIEFDSMITTVSPKYHWHTLYNPCSGFGCAKVALEFVIISQVTKSSNFILSSSLTPKFYTISLPKCTLY